MPRHGPPYPEEFRREAVRLAKLGGKPRWKLAKELGITEVTLRKWLRQDTAEQEAPRKAEARARREGEENALPRAGGQGALGPDSGAG
ncbi:MAG: transposase, partial [Solirubrobacterales bacterium]|nr:transposase [Solirubrobacterales bacterium]